jgi:hypothetical protein
VSSKASKVTFSDSVKAGLRQRVLSELQRTTSIDEEGQVSWAGFTDVDQLIEALGDAFDFPADISRRERSAIVFRGLIDARKSGKVTDSSALEAVQRIVNQRLSEPLRQFGMWSRVSCRPTTDQSDKHFAYADVSIRLSRKLPTYMQLNPDDLLDHKPHHITDKPGFCFLIARTRARNFSHAADKIFHAKEIFSAIYNLALRSWNIFGSEQKPEAALLTGPYYFMFKGDRYDQKSGTWFNPEFRDEFWALSSTNAKNVTKAAGTIRKALSRLENHPLKEPLSAALLMMNEGMEAADMTRRTLRYWTALERLFQVDGENIRNEKIIRRATYLDNPADLSRAKLNRLMRIRNRYVHNGATDHDHHQLAQYLAEHIRSDLFYLLFNGDDFAEHAEFIEMTDLPSDSLALERRRLALERRERMIDRRRHRPD